MAKKESEGEFRTGKGEDALERHGVSRRGDHVAARFLEQRGYDILDLSWECEHGLVDVVCRDEAALVFVEVSVSGVERGGGLPELGDRAKRLGYYERVAASYLRAHDMPGTEVRFERVGVIVVGRGKALLRHCRSAFGEEATAICA